MVARMELRHLRYFVAVAQELNFTKAARKLRVAQPALSRQIRQLEDEVGVALLERNRRGTRLTEAGRAFLAEAGSILDRSEQAVRVAQNPGTSGRGLLNVGYVWGLFHSLAPATVARFRARFPDVAVNLFEDQEGELTELTWQERALCAQTDPEAFFPEKGGSTREAKKVCLGCDVRGDCLEYALAHDERFGIWGGLSERERRRLKKEAV